MGAYGNDANTTCCFLFTSGAAYIFKRNTPIPIELINFSGKNTEGGNLLTWQTATEQNNKGFFVERRTDNRQWITLGFVNAHNKASNYQFLDDKTSLKFEISPTTYYRLRQIDFDGKETFSKVISIIQKGKGLEAYPTLVSNGFLTIDTEGEQSQAYTIINLLGQQVLSGKMTHQVNVSVLAQGTYILKVGSEVVKFVKQ